jgi:hypothetical protein
MRHSISILFIGLLAFTGALWGQTSLGAGSIQGTVQDPSGAAVLHAQITVTNVATGLVRTAVTDSSGRYTVLSLFDGAYEVQATAPGFKSTLRKGINIEIGTTALVDFSLQVGNVSAEITITVAPPLIESSNATIGELIENKNVVTLPLNGRSYTQLATLAPGVSFGGNTVGDVTQNPSLGTNGNFSISGARAEGSEFTLNGITVTNEFTGGTYAYPPIDSIQEFKLLQSNYSAEFGYRSRHEYLPRVPLRIHPQRRVGCDGLLQQSGRDRQVAAQAQSIRRIDRRSRLSAKIFGKQSDVLLC